MFKREFAELVASGAKLQTVRPCPKAVPFPGDGLSLREWTGLPYRSPQRQLRQSVVRAVRVIRIEWDCIWMQPPPDCLMEIAGAETICLRGDSADRFARDDGFADWGDMRAWFEAEHGLPFDGIVIYWDSCDARAANSTNKSQSEP